MLAIFSPGGDQPPPARPDDRLCQLLDCLLGGKSIGPELERELSARGIHLRALLECLENHCRESEVALGGERPFSPRAGAVEPARTLLLQEVRDALLAVEQRAVGTPAHFAELVKGEEVHAPKPDEAAMAEHKKFRENPFPKLPPAKKGHGR